MCGSDLHQNSGYIPAMRSGDVIGHAFLGEIVEVGPEVSRRSVGDRGGRLLGDRLRPVLVL